jgi:transcriptional regulator with XRE-family HTH domain
MRFGSHVRIKRKNLGVSSTELAESAGMSRITLYRIEKGEPSVTMGAYLNAMTAIGLTLGLNDRAQVQERSNFPLKKIPLAKYPELKRLAWQLRGSKEVSPKEALELYERNWRHIDHNSLNLEEQDLIQNLLTTFGRQRLLV